MLAPIPGRWIALLAAGKVAATMAFADRYGWHGDELYFLATSRHLAHGYVDFPAIVPLLAAADGHAYRRLTLQWSPVGTRTKG